MVKGLKAYWIGNRQSGIGKRKGWPSTTYTTFNTLKKK